MQGTEIRKPRTIILWFLLVGLIISISFFIGCLEKPEGLPIVIIGRDSASGTREFFFDHVMNNTNFSIYTLEKNSNGGVYQTVSQTPGAIGYIGLGYLDDAIKAIKINNVAATIANITAGTYPIARDLYLFIKGNATGATKEFIDYLQSIEGQVIVREEGFVPLDTNLSYNASGKSLTGTLTISGSTTVFPIAEKAKESFQHKYPDIVITVSSTGSGAGIQAVHAGTVDIGMSSRDLKASESTFNLVRYIIGKDGIALIVHPSNTYVNSLTLEQVKALYAGEITNWNQLH